MFWRKCTDNKTHSCDLSEVFSSCQKGSRDRFISLFHLYLQQWEREKNHTLSLKIMRRHRSQFSPLVSPSLLNKSDVPHQGQLVGWQNLLEWNRRGAGTKPFSAESGVNQTRRRAASGDDWKQAGSTRPPRRGATPTSRLVNGLSPRKKPTCALANEAQLDPWHLSTSATSILKRAQMLQWKGTNKLPLLLPVACCCFFIQLCRNPYIHLHALAHLSIDLLILIIASQS